MPAVDDDPRRAIRRSNLVGFATIVVLIGGVGGWAATSELSGAVIAPASLVVESSVKKIQHAAGGVVRELLVDEGAAVQAGQVLVRLDDTAARAALGIVQSGLDTQFLRVARLMAERDGQAKMGFPDGLLDRRDDATVRAAFASEQNLFVARRTTLAGQRAQLSEQVKQLNEEILGVSAQIDADDIQIDLTKKRLANVASLFAKNLVSVDQQTSLQMDQAKLAGERGQLVAEIARSRGKISEIELQSLQLDKDFQTGVLNDLRDADGKTSELLERRAAAEDELHRIDIRAPQSGVVHELAVHAVGEVVEPGETIMSIVPRADTLVIEAKVAAEDIDQVVMGAAASVRILAGNRRTVPTVDATVTRVAADLSREPQSTRSFYLVRLAMAANALATLGDLHLLPGMTAEVFFATEKRTPLEYLLKPLGEQIARTFRER